MLLRCCGSDILLRQNKSGLLIPAAPAGKIAWVRSIPSAMLSFTHGSERLNQAKLLHVTCPSSSLREIAVIEIAMVSAWRVCYAGEDQK